MSWNKGGRDLDPEEFLDVAAQLVVSGKVPVTPALAEAFGVTEYWARLARADLGHRGRWPYRKGTGLAFGSPTPAEVRAACERLGLPCPGEVVVAEPRTPLAERVAQYRREWRDGHNFLARSGWDYDEDD